MRAAVGLLALAVAACGTAASPCGPSSALVTNTVDGDTIDINGGADAASSGGKRLRLLLVDATETTNGHNDCYGQEAAAHTRDTLLNKTIGLKYDTQCTDKYGRTLAYVTVDGKDFNLSMVTDGFACTLYIAPDGMARKQEFIDAESVAKTNRTGIWGACAVVTCEG